MQTAPYDLERGYSIYSGSVIKMLLTYFMAQQPFKIPYIIYTGSIIKMLFTHLLRGTIAI